MEFIFLMCFVLLIKLSIDYNEKSLKFLFFRFGVKGKLIIYQHPHLPLRIAKNNTFSFRFSALYFFVCNIYFL